MPTEEQRAYYVRRAAEVRKMAAVASDPEIRETLATMAKSYDTLVEEANRDGATRRGANRPSLDRRTI